MSMKALSASRRFRFMAYRRHALVLSAAATLVAIVSIAWQGLKLGLDFTGGVIAEVHYSAAPDLADIRSNLSAAGFPDAQVQSFDSALDVLIRLPPMALADTSETQRVLLKALESHTTEPEISRLEQVGPEVGDDLTEQGGLAMLFALLGIFFYVTLRFRWKFALGTIVATLHDTVVTIGLFSLFRWEFDLTVLGAVLAVIGYSVNDTIVLYDRIRDNFRQMGRFPVIDIIDASITQTLSRTILTSLTTLLVVFALLFLGGDALKGFAMAMAAGIAIGTYSTIYVASTMALALNVRTEDFVTRLAAAEDDMP